MLSRWKNQAIDNEGAENIRRSSFSEGRSFVKRETGSGLTADSQRFPEGFLLSQL